MATKFEEIKNKISKATTEQKEKTRRDYKELYDHPLLYAALISSGFLSALAGLAVGLGVHMENGTLVYTVDLPHVFFAVLYAILFPYFYEFGLANWLYKFLHREPENKTQEIVAGIMISITFIGTSITAYSAMDVLVTAGGFFDSFKEIPAGVQKWIAYSLPTMFLLNIASGEIYRQFTAEAILLRAANIELRGTKIAADMEVKLSQMDAQKKMAIAESEEYSRRAEIEAPELGKNRGASTWQKDSAGYKVPAMNQNAAESEIVRLRAELERLTPKS